MCGRGQCGDALGRLWIITGKFLVPLMVIASCGPRPTPDNPEPARRGLAFQAEYRDPSSPPENPRLRLSTRMNAERCRPHRGTGPAGAGKRSATADALMRERLSPADLLDIRVADDDTFSGDYVVSQDGTLRLPFLDPLPALGRTVQEVETALSRALVRVAFFSAGPRISVRLRDFAAVRVAVSGAVYEPHSVTIGGTRGDEIDQARQAALGDSDDARTLSAALRAAGGVRPDADLSAIELHRAGTRYRLDMRGAITGDPVEDVPLLAGDRVIVLSRDCFQPDLMVPGPISPPGISLFLSNLTQPATGNAPSAIGRAAREVPYGTRMMQAVVGTNCVGGARATSAHRSAALFSRNPMTGNSVVIERRIENMRARADRDQYDPWLLPGDAIACYDSNLTNLGEVGRVLGLVGTIALVAD